MKRILCALCAVLFLVGCENIDTTSSLPSEPVDTPSSSEVLSSEPEVQYDDLLLTMADCGEEITAMGDLQNPEYAEALSELEAVLQGYNRNASVVAYSLDNRKALGYNTQAMILLTEQAAMIRSGAARATISFMATPAQILSFILAARILSTALKMTIC